MTDCVLRAPVQFRQRRLKVAIGPKRTRRPWSFVSVIGVRADIAALLGCGSF